ncbi:MAG: hypothetical protein CMQ20_16775 [Gammaproteobacteria bacterium]|jgi:hypothetical protein|nr:hypothetical protein [Gammaproteobacteria bacterium]|tara:strand:+ start:307 stop:810 length:504 start_codon:yes stop_codon:yes gene_type:complete
MKILFLCLVLSFLTACAGNHSGISSNVDVCCSNSEYRTFLVNAKDIPAFLSPLMMNSFSVAFANYGFQPVSEKADLDVELKYVQQKLGTTLDRDGFDERIAPGGEVRFVAKIIVDMRDAETHETVWSGSIQRTHDVSSGEYMHTGRASIALLDSFNELLKGYHRETR